MRRITAHLLILFMLFVSGCRQHMFRASAGSMENTLMAGETFYVTLTTHPEKNDIVVFYYTGPDYRAMDEETGKFKDVKHRRIYRLIAWSGNVVEIKDGEVFVDQRHIPLPPKGKKYYEVASKVPIEEFENAKEESFDMTSTQHGDTLVYIATLTSQQAFDYEQRKPAVLFVRKKLMDVNDSDTSIARGASTGKWSIDQYGPLKIPSPGDTIVVDEINRRLYHNIPGIMPGKNIIKEKLYFLLGDNRGASEDSRYIGLISESNLYGVVK